MRCGTGRSDGSTTVGIDRLGTGLKERGSAGTSRGRGAVLRVTYDHGRAGAGATRKWGEPTSWGTAMHTSAHHPSRPRARSWGATLGAVLAAAVLPAVLLAAPAGAVPGSLDPSFDS